MTYLARLLFAPLKPLFDLADRRCAEMKAKALADEELRAEVEGLDFIEPPDEYARQELITERVLDNANGRWFEQGDADLAAWEEEVAARG